MANLLKVEAQAGTSCGYHRISLPYSSLVAVPRRPTFVFNRMPAGGLTDLRARLKLGFAVVADLDDSWDLDADHYLYASLSDRKAAIIEAMSLATVVTVSTSLLADDVRPYNPRVVVVPNALPFDTGQFTRAPENPREGAVYAAGASHREDFRILAEALQGTGLDGGVHLAGYQSMHAEWSAMRAMAPRAHRHTMRPIEGYMAVYDGRAIALAPLRDTPFNRRKSNLKMLEAGCKGLPLIASPVLPYFNPVDAPFVEYVHDASGWRAALGMSAESARERGEALAEHVRKHYDMAAANTIRRQVIESL